LRELLRDGKVFLDVADEDVSHAFDGCSVQRGAPSSGGAGRLPFVPVS
jgi:hypothetical protein